MQMVADIIKRFRFSTGYWDMFVYVANNLKVLRLAPVEKVFHHQLQISGLDALSVIAIIALCCGTLVITQVTSFVGGNSELTVKMLIWIVVQEIGPLLSAMVIIARSSAAVASELALMKVNQELRNLESMDISVLNYLIVPRVAGITLAVAALSIYFQIVAVGGGLLVSTLFQNTSMLEQSDRFLQIIGMMDFLIVIFKGFLFGTAIATISCYHGIYASNAYTGVPRAAIKAVIRSLLAVFLLDLVIAYLRGLF